MVFKILPGTIPIIDYESVHIEVSFLVVFGTVSFSKFNLLNTFNSFH